MYHHELYNQLSVLVLSAYHRCPLPLLLYLLQNLYRIFFAQPTDLAGLLPPLNPWYVNTCNSLPLLPAVQPVPAQKGRSDGRSKTRTKSPPIEFEMEDEFWFSSKP
jgi:hypothetical protein